MYLPHVLILLSFAALCGGSLVEAKIETFYFDKQKVFRVDAVVAEELLMKEIDPSEVSDYTGDRTDAWWVKGTLPLESACASVFSHYSITTVSNPFKERNEPPHSEVTLRIPRGTTRGIENKEGWDAFVVVAWLHEQALSSYHVLDSNPIGRKGGQIVFDIPTEKSSGVPVAWVVKGGEVLKKGRIDVWDEAAFSKSFDKARVAARKPDIEGKSVAHYAAVNGLTELLSMALAVSKRSATVVDRERYSPIWYAARNGRASAVQLLLEAGAPREVGAQQQSVLGEAARHGQLDCVKLLAPDRAKGKKGKADYSWALSQALSSRSVPIVRYLLERGATFSVSDRYRGEQVLALFSKGYPDLAAIVMDELKVKAGVDNRGYGLLHAVAPYATVELLESVAARGAKADLLTDKGMAPADFAIGLGNVDAICWFFDNARGSIGRPGGIDPLTYAIKEGQLDSVGCLFGYGIEVNKEVGPGISPLMYAAFLGKFDIAALILEKGGKWHLDGDYSDMIVLKLLAADRVELFASLVEQGWQAERLLAAAFTALEVARFHDAKRILEYMESQEWDTSNYGIYPVSEVEVKPAALNALAVDYPEPLQDKFGARSVLTTLAISAGGVPVTAKAKLEPEEEALRSIVENAALRLRFNPAGNGSEPVPVALMIRVPLTVDFDPDQVLEMAEVDEKPRAIRQVAPMYPFAMQELRRNGEVLVEFVLLPDGSIRSARVVRSDHFAFEAPALAAVRSSTFLPAKRNGYPVACRVRVPIGFSIK